jgi:predicted HicB family RNase H-like nuclease
VTKMVRRKSGSFYMRISPELKEAAEKAADADERSLASLIEALLTEYCQEHGFLRPKLPRKRRD